MLTHDTVANLTEATVGSGVSIIYHIYPSIYKG